LSAETFQEWEEGLRRQTELVRARPWFQEAEQRREERLRERVAAGSILCVTCGKAIKPGARYHRVFYANIEVDGDHYSHALGRCPAGE
jgi:hypothetical protein